MMTEEKFQAITLDAERYVSRTSFGCSRECTHDFYYHAQPLLDCFYAIAEQEFWHDELSDEHRCETFLTLPDCPCDLGERFFDEVQKFRERLEAACAA